VGALDRRICTRGYMFQLFSGAVSGMRMKQVVYMFSTIEAIYMEDTHAYKKSIWLTNICSEVEKSIKDIIVHCDSNNGTFLTNNLTFHVKEKNINIQYHFIRDMVDDRKVILDKVDTL
jgi:hypothetical protein